MAKRKRMGIVKCFRAAFSNSSAVGDVEGSSILMGIVFGFWWWIAGVPQEPTEEQKPES